MSEKTDPKTGMVYRRFGKTELSIPVLSCGGMRYQHSWSDLPVAEIPQANQDNLEKTIRRSLEVGINHIETARGYGSSEVQLGRILPHLPREKMLIQTKVGPSENAADFLKTFDLSMERLQLDYVDFFSIHGINNEETLHQTLRKGGCLEAALKLRAEGRCRHVGFSTHGPLHVILDAIQCGDFEYVNLHWYFIFQHNWPAIQAARKLDMGVFIISPNDKGGMLYKPSEKLARLCQPVSPMIFNDLFCLSHSDVHTLSIGASKPTDFDEHLKALSHLPQAREITTPIEQKLRTTLQETLGEDFIDPYESAIPSWEKVPGQINIREIFRLWILAKGLDMTDYGKMRYNLLGNGGHWFPGLPATEMEASKIASFMASHPRAARVVPILQEAHEMLKGEAKKRLSQSK